MNIASAQPDIAPDPILNKAQLLLSSGVGNLRRFADDLKPLKQALASVTSLADDKVAQMAAKLQGELDALEPSVTMIGQIKSGKTSLVNCMIGVPDLLPTDVNPWTSVVTSLHMLPDPVIPETSAKFCFFEEDEWDRLIAGGGRIGELANRAGADDELAKIKTQVAQMREKSKARLGDKFELLLGQQHDYGYFDNALIERYVCLGDDFDGKTSEDQGRFADITRSADLRFHQPAMPLRMCIRDTPGVNDTFMIREQITIRSIRESRICVVVLSAHQALSATDLALVRLISNMKSRDVIIFVNRIDELSDPVTQVPEIRASILETLRRNDGPADATVLFGSAVWAQGAMTGSFAKIPEASKVALMQLARATGDPEIQRKSARAVLWQMSALPELYEVIGQRVSEDEGRETCLRVAASARNLINGMRQTDNLAAKIRVGETTVRMTPDEIAEAVETLRKDSQVRIETALAQTRDAFSERLDRVHDSFLARATEALLEHLEIEGEDALWEYDPSGLRLLLRSSYQSFGRATQTAFATCIAQITADVHALYERALNLPADLFDIKPPPALRIPPPVSLGQTIALDIKGGWWKNWWYRRRGYQAYAADFQKLIHAETIGFITDLKGQHVMTFHAKVLGDVARFQAEQLDVLLNLANTPSLTPEALDTLLDRQTLISRDAELAQALRQLDRYAT